MYCAHPNENNELLAESWPRLRLRARFRYRLERLVSQDRMRPDELQRFGHEHRKRQKHRGHRRSSSLLLKFRWEILRGAMAI